MLVSVWIPDVYDELSHSTDSQGKQGKKRLLGEGTEILGLYVMATCLMFPN